MQKAILEFTLNGRKNTYFRRIDTFGQPLTTTNVHSAKKVNLREVKGLIKLLVEKLGAKDVKVIEGEI